MADFSGPELEAHNFNIGDIDSDGDGAKSISDLDFGESISDPYHQ